MLTASVMIGEASPELSVTSLKPVDESRMTSNAAVIHSSRKRIRSLLYDHSCCCSVIEEFSTLNLTSLLFSPDIVTGKSV
jgi:hypothetical protein